ncbi:hypothetical protein Ade02nite_46020 [Paractinoplanes deccanensis]|uniref:Uncharacterized protein n=1 Tax=Paractinoplanes deccanensis TaxID=113561 RepID=A0ABQ3Y7L2_9ACTN|nr:hypothetical protein [Actinoplanes deccanensis]GID75961.1 hypothetical protein Ade02nite_46020 [Actinoplanes deccanensis]
MSIPEEDRSGDEGVYRSAETDRRQRRRKQRAKQAAVGVAGLAVLGAGAFFVTTQVAGRNAGTETRDAGALAPMASPATGVPPSTAPSAEPTAEADTVAPSKGAVKQSSSPTPAPSRSLSVEEQIKEAREKAAKDGHPVQRALTAAPNAKPGPVNKRNETLPNGTLRVITAKHDLTGQGELLWAADKGKKIGQISCTQNFKFSNNSKASVRPNMLLCWRTSAGKSVVTVLVDQDGKPSTEKSAEVINSEWAKLG